MSVYVPFKGKLLECFSNEFCPLRFWYELFY